MQSDFIKILDDIEASAYNPETKGKLQSATMLLWSLQDAKRGGTGVVTWNGIVVSNQGIPVPPTPPQEEPTPIPETIPEPTTIPEPLTEEPKEEPKTTTRKSVKLEKQKELKTKLSEINLDDL
jgi:outer membrane biosynthesis protein TonB